MGERSQRETEQRGRDVGVVWECNWTLDNTFLESFTSSASPVGEWPRLFFIGAEKAALT